MHISSANKLDAYHYGNKSIYDCYNFIKKQNLKNITYCESQCVLRLNTNFHFHLEYFSSAGFFPSYVVCRVCMNSKAFTKLQYFIRKNVQETPQKHDFAFQSLSWMSVRREGVSHQDKKLNILSQSHIPCERAPGAVFGENVTSWEESLVLKNWPRLKQSSWTDVRSWNAEL